eukprot:Nitzschia sp. Nitz4//scaffold181_size46380//31151//32075//NITZ4_007181-RA/size46380-augustus-gene-0.46-mRNA-1//-1//CDS//3329539522//8005//frame0
MSSPSICGGFLTDKRSMVAFTWTITTVMTYFAFLTAIVLIVQIQGHYRKLERSYENGDYYNRYLEDGGGGQDEDHEASHDGEDEYRHQMEAIVLLTSMTARSVSFVAAYTMILATGLSLYGSTAIVGFTSLRGVYIAPCFPSGSDTMRVGIFGGAVVLFANLLLVCAVVLGEVRVEDYKREDGEDGEEYQVERIATVLAVTCMFLSVLYTIFAVLLFLCFASDDFQLSDVDVASSHAKTPLVSVTGAVNPDARQLDSPGFITMENSSQGTA